MVTDSTVTRMQPEAGKARDRAGVLGSLDPIWSRVLSEAEKIVGSEPSLASFVMTAILNQPNLEQAVVHRVAARLGHAVMPADLIAQTFAEAVAETSLLSQMFRADLAAVLDRDAACDRFIEPLLYFKGFHAIQTHRLAHWLWVKGRRDFALYLQSRSSETFQTDIHPAAVFGRGIFLDHATGLVVGSTAVVGDNVSILQDVTLGGTGKETGDRHPKIENGVLIGAGAKILGNIRIGHCARIAAGSVVLMDVPHNKTMAGVPARVVGEAGCAEPSRAMDQYFDGDAGL
jgi:serine O-acetyltransferase